MNGNTLIYLGLALILLSFAYPMVTVIVDDTPPKWIIASDGEVAIFPRDGQTYQSVSKITAGVEDFESGVASVTAVIDGQTFYLKSISGGSGGGGAKIQMFSTVVHSGYWQCDIPPLSAGQHTMTLTAENGNGLKTIYKATFTVYTNLQGDWYINGEKVTGSDQILRFTTRTLTFKFVKTQGVDDSKIRCSVWEGNAKLLELKNVAAGTWEGTYTFTGGKHALTLKANDGTNTVTFAVVTVDFGGEQQPSIEWLTMPNILLFSGILLVFFGWFSGRRRS
ncbi:hypothetical protein DRO19_00175 [Candidatus Bathyarchaeota archaeon]|nr:MAG: hypothetical protein DRO19_00175 [Candidatus Bathyarchaeota archaeon]